MGIFQTDTAETPKNPFSDVEEQCAGYVSEYVLHTFFEKYPYSSSPKKPIFDRLRIKKQAHDTKWQSTNSSVINGERV